MSNVSRSPTDLVKGIGTYRNTQPFIEFWVAVWQDSGLFLIFVPFCIWTIIGITCAMALFYQKVMWVSRLAGVGTDSGHNLHSLPTTLNPSWLWSFALAASSLNMAYYYFICTLWANTDTAFSNTQLFILQICASVATAVFVLVAAVNSTKSMIECMNYRDSAHKAPEPAAIAKSKKHPSHKQLEQNRSLWKEDSMSAELAGDAPISGPIFGTISHSVSIVHNTATRRETVSVFSASTLLHNTISPQFWQVVVASFGIICALASVLSDLSIMDLTSFIKIELVIATNFDLVWKDSISNLGQVHNCYGYINAYEKVLQTLNFRDLVAVSALLIAFVWMSSAVGVFVEFSGCSDLPSRLVNDVGSASFTTAFAVMTLLFMRLAFDLLWVASNLSVFWGYMMTDDTYPFSSLPHMPCLPAIG
jgi:hypothetical protein